MDHIGLLPNITKGEKQVAKRYKELTDQEKCEIYNSIQSGCYYIKDITKRYNITEYTIRKVVDEINYFLRVGTPKDL